MSSTAVDRPTTLWMRVVWILVTISLIAAVVAIYWYLRPSHLPVAEPVVFDLEEGKSFTMDDLPMGKYYRLRACDRSVEVLASIGLWSSGWITLRVNQDGDYKADLRVDGRSGGELEITSRGSTGRLILYQDKKTVSCVRE